MEQILITRNAIIEEHSEHQHYKNNNHFIFEIG